MKDVVNVDEVSQYLRLHPMTVYRMTRSKIIPGFKVGGQWRFKMSEIQKWIENNLNMEGTQCA